MEKGKSQEWIDTISKLLLPLVIFGAGLLYSSSKDKADRAAQQFDRDTGILKLVVSSNERERLLGLKVIDIQRANGELSPYLSDAVTAVSQGAPSDASTVAAKAIVETTRKDAAAQAGPTSPGSQAPAPSAEARKNPPLFLQIAREDQRAEAATLQSKLQGTGFSVQGIQLVQSPTTNNYVRYFSAPDKDLSDKVVALMKENGITASSQSFTSLNKNGSIAQGTIEVWLGTSQAAITN